METGGSEVQATDNYLIVGDSLAYVKSPFHVYVFVHVYNVMYT